MEEVTRSYFQNLFSTSGVEDIDTILSRVARCILSNANKMLTTKYTKEDVYSGMKDMVPTKASGADGFLTLFFQKR